MLKFYPDDWQASTLMDLANNPRVSVRSGQGVGKTGLEAATALWFLSCFPYPKVICTAPTRQQLHDVLWAEINKWQSKSPVLKRILKWTKTKIYMKNYEERWFATARTATKPENMQGFHEDYMLFIVDEASGVADPIMEAILGTLSGEFNKILMCGNPTKTSGVFYDSHNKDRADYKTRKVSCLDSPRTSKDNIAMLKRKYGEGSDVWRVRVEGEFPRGESDTFISLEVAEFAAKEVKLEPNGDMLTIGVDVARFGDDETSMFAGIGPRVVGEHHHFKKDTMATAGWVINLAKELHVAHPYLNRIRIRVDDSGVGGGVTDRLNEIVAEEGLPYEIIPINNGSSSLDEHYGNLVTEMWASIKEQLEQNMSNFINGEKIVKDTGEKIIEHFIEPIFKFNFKATLSKIDVLINQANIADNEKEFLNYLKRIVISETVAGQDTSLSYIKEIYPMINDTDIEEFIKDLHESNKTVAVWKLLESTKRYSYEVLLNSIVNACVKLQGNHIYRNSSEDDRNGFIKNILETIGFCIKDQTRWGISNTGKSAGEVDLLIEEKNSPYSIIEALNLTSLDAKYLNLHINKIFKYDTTGLPCNFIISYVKIKDFGLFWEKYKKHITEHEYPYKLETIDYSIGNEFYYSGIKIVLTKHNRDGMITGLYHICVNISE
ncbi:Terminase-like family protein [compost metagenome]